jgi:small subunit ribosomal protein S1
MLKKTKTEEAVEVAAETKKVKKEKVVVEPKLDTVMDRIIHNSANPPLVADLVEGPVINIEKSAVYIDLAPFGTGIIFGREYLTARDIIKKINIGDVVAAKVVDTNNKEGYIELSLKEARQALSGVRLKQQSAGRNPEIPCH